MTFVRDVEEIAQKRETEADAELRVKDCPVSRISWTPPTMASRKAEEPAIFHK